jgi:hypothetical protein
MYVNIVMFLKFFERILECTGYCCDIWLHRAGFYLSHVNMGFVV